MPPKTFSGSKDHRKQSARKVCAISEKTKTKTEKPETEVKGYFN